MATITTREVAVGGFIPRFVALVGLRHGFDQRPTAGEPGDGEAGEVGGCLSTCEESCDW